MIFCIEQKRIFFQNQNHWYCLQKTDINKNIQLEYDKLTTNTSSNESLSDLQENEYNVDWTDNIYLVTSVIMSELNGRFGFKNLYHGNGKIENVSAFTQTVLIEFPIHQYQNLLFDTILKMNKTGSKRYNDAAMTAIIHQQNMLIPL